MTRVALRGRSKKARRPAVVRLTPIILFVRRFEPCLKFYQRALHLRLLRIYEGKNHPAWAELQAGEIRLCLHAGYEGPPYRQGRPVAIHFDVTDIHRTVGKVTQYGGTVKRAPRKFDFRPAELQVAYQATFRDPDGNEFEAIQVVEEF